jgi:hypothetical protein
MANLLDATLLAVGNQTIDSTRILLNKARILNVTEGATNTDIVYAFANESRTLTLSGTGLDVLYRPEWDKTLSGTIVGIGSDLIGKDTNYRIDTKDIVSVTEDYRDATRSVVQDINGKEYIYAIDLDAVLSAVGVVRRYKALITQSGTNAPTAEVLEDTLEGSRSYTYGSVGQYRYLGTFDVTKTIVTIGGGVSTGLVTHGMTATHINIETYKYGEIAFSLQNGVLLNTTFIIEVYP